MITAAFLCETPNPGSKLVLVALADHADDSGESCFPSQALLGRKCSMTPQGVRRNLRVLEKAGVISWQSSRRGNRYKLWLNEQNVANKTFHQIEQNVLSDGTKRSISANETFHLIEQNVPSDSTKCATNHQQPTITVSEPPMRMGVGDPADLKFYLEWAAIQNKGNSAGVVLPDELVRSWYYSRAGTGWEQQDGRPIPNTMEARTANLMRYALTVKQNGSLGQFSAKKTKGPADEVPEPDGDWRRFCAVHLGFDPPGAWSGLPARLKKEVTAAWMSEKSREAGGEA